MRQKGSGKYSDADTATGGQENRFQFPFPEFRLSVSVFARVVSVRVPEPEVPPELSAPVPSRPPVSWFTVMESWVLPVVELGSGLLQDAMVKPRKTR